MKQKMLITTILVLLGVSGIILLAQGGNTRTPTQNTTNSIKGVPDKVEYLQSLNFFAKGDTGYTIQATFVASPASGTNTPTLLASGTLTVGTGNSNIG